MQKYKLFVPGRLCLFGEYSDWAEIYPSMNSALVAGEATITGTVQGIYATVEKSENFEMTCSAESLQSVWYDLECPMNAEALKDVAHSGSFQDYGKEYLKVQDDTSLSVLLDELIKMAWIRMTWQPDSVKRKAFIIIYNIVKSISPKVKVGKMQQIILDNGYFKWKHFCIYMNLSHRI